MLEVKMIVYHVVNDRWNNLCFRYHPHKRAFISQCPCCQDELRLTTKQIAQLCFTTDEPYLLCNPRHRVGKILKFVKWGVKDAKKMAYTLG